MSGRTPDGNDGGRITTGGKAPHPGDSYAHFAENHAELKARYPGQFHGTNLGLCWPDGWHALVAGVCAYAGEHGIPVCWLQIKEKLGELRMYGEAGVQRADAQGDDCALSFASTDGDRTAQGTPTLETKIREAQTASLQTCSLCGTADASAQVRRRVLAGSWFTACDRCVPGIQAFVASHRDQR